MIRPLRITFVITSTQLAGAERVLLDVVAGLDRSRFHPSLITLTGVGGLLDEAKKLGVIAESLEMRSPVDVPRLLRLGARLRAHDPHIVHTFLMHANVAGRIAARLSSIPAVVSSIHGEYRRKWYRFIERGTMGLADRVLTVSEAILRIYSKRFSDPTRIQVLPNGILVEPFPGESQREAARESLGLDKSLKYLLVVARLTPEKGLKYLLEAMPAVVERYHAVQLLILGDGPLRAPLERLASRSGAGDRIEFLGFRSDVSIYMRACDLFVLPSLTEGMPRTILEAANCGIPVIASDVSGIPEIVSDGVSARLVTPGNSRLLAEAITSLLSDQAGAVALAKKARERLEKEFTLETMIARHENVYTELAAQAGIEIPEPQSNGHPNES